jgi:hypothetical protein
LAALIAYGSWLNTSLTHDWAGDDFLPSQIAGAIGPPSDPALIVFGVANIRRGADDRRGDPDRPAIRERARNRLNQTYVRVHDRSTPT